MKRALTLLLLLGAVNAMAQNLDELERRNGFKSIVLGSPADSIHGSVFVKEIEERDEFPARLYQVDDAEFKTIGEVEVKDVKIKSYQGMIYEIRVSTAKDPRIMRALEKSFGKGNYVVRTGLYKWVTAKLSLTFQAHRNSIELIYRCHPVIQKMYADKGKKIDDIAADF